MCIVCVCMYVCMYSNASHLRIIFFLSSFFLFSHSMFYWKRADFKELSFAAVICFSPFIKWNVALQRVWSRWNVTNRIAGNENTISPLSISLRNLVSNMWYRELLIYFDIMSLSRDAHRENCSQNFYELYMVYDICDYAWKWPKSQM